MKPVLVCQHTPTESPGLAAEVFGEIGLPFVLSRQFQPGAAAFDPEAHSGLVVLGGQMGANDTAEYPFLAREIGWLQTAVRRQLPVLGICLGAQLLARALGGRVVRNPVPEIGWLPVALTEAGAADPLLRHLAPTATVFQFHQDTFDLPAGATLLAQSAACRHQAIRVGGRAYGVQFHPEVTPGILAGWREDLPDPGAVDAEAPRHLPEMTERSRRLFAAWAELVGEPGPGGGGGRIGPPRGRSGRAYLPTAAWMALRAAS